PPRPPPPPGGARGPPAEPLPLELDHGPDPSADGVRQRRRGVLGPREGERAPHPNPDLLRADPPAAAPPLGPGNGDRHNRGPGLQRQAAEAAFGTAERAGSVARPLREDAD